MRGNRAEGIRELLDEPIVIMTETSRKTKTGMGTKKMKTAQIGTNQEKLEMEQKGNRTGRTGNDTEDGNDYHCQIRGQGQQQANCLG